MQKRFRKFLFLSIWILILFFSCSCDNPVRDALYYSEINIKQGTTNIPTDGSYNLGDVVEGTFSVAIVFTIENTGSIDLELTGKPEVSISGTHSSEFSVQAQPTSPVAAGKVTNFTIIFNPASTGPKAAAVIILNNDADEGSYTFSIKGEVLSYDVTSPSVTISSSAGDPTNTSPIPVIITFSETVIEFVVGDIVVGNGSAGNLQSSDNIIFTVDITPSGNRVAVTIDVASGVAVDAAGNVNMAATQFSIGYDSSVSTYAVTYDGNGNTIGSVPTDNNNYEEGETVTVLGNNEGLVKNQDGISLLFIGWNIAYDGSGTGYIADDTFSMSATNLTLYAQWSVIGVTGPAGGYVFFDKGSYSEGWRYLEAASIDQSSGIEWDGYGTTLGVTSIAVGTGLDNTTAIVSALGSGTYAAKICYDLVLNGFDDWFLPSRGELNLMYSNLHIQGIGGFSDAPFYWSSSEWSNADFSAIYAWLQNFSNGSQGGNSKYYAYRVRAVRAF